MDGVIRSNVDYPTWLEKVRSELKQGDLSTYDYIWDGARISPFEEKIILSSYMPEGRDSMAYRR